jgi:hypothetical protein
MAAFVQGYRIGEIVDTDLRLEYKTLEVMRSQMPLFAIDGSAEFILESTYLHAGGTFALAFEEGLWTLPSVALKNKNQEYIQSWQVDLTYSKSGSLQSVSYGAPVYAKEQPKTVRVDYKWIVEKAPHVGAALHVMFIVVLAAAMYFINESSSLTSADTTSSSSTGWGVKEHHK